MRLGLELAFLFKLLRRGEGVWEGIMVPIPTESVHWFVEGSFLWCLGVWPPFWVVHGRFEFSSDGTITVLLHSIVSSVFTVHTCHFLLRDYEMGPPEMVQSEDRGVVRGRAKGETSARFILPGTSSETGIDPDPLAGAGNGESIKGM